MRDQVQRALAHADLLSHDKRRNKLAALVKSILLAHGEYSHDVGKMADTVFTSGINATTAKPAWWPDGVDFLPSAPTQIRSINKIKELLNAIVDVDEKNLWQATSAGVTQASAPTVTATVTDATQDRDADDEVARDTITMAAPAAGDGGNETEMGTAAVAMTVTVTAAPPAPDATPASYQTGSETATMDAAAAVGTTAAPPVTTSTTPATPQPGSDEATSVNRGRPRRKTTLKKYSR